MMASTRLSARDIGIVLRGLTDNKVSPAVRLRTGLHRLGYRFRLYAPEIAGQPDIILRPRRALIFLNGPQWYSGEPRPTRRSYHAPQFRRGEAPARTERDAATCAELARSGWRICEISDTSITGPNAKTIDDLLRTCAMFLDGNETYRIVKS